MKIITSAPESMSRIFYERDEKKRKKLDAARRRASLSKILRHSALGQLFAFFSGVSCCGMAWTMANNLYPLTWIFTISMIVNLMFSHSCFVLVEKKIEDLKREEVK